MLGSARCVPCTLKIGHQIPWKLKLQLSATMKPASRYGNPHWMEQLSITLYINRRRAALGQAAWLESSGRALVVDHLLA